MKRVLLVLFLVAVAVTVYKAAHRKKKPPTAPVPVDTRSTRPPKEPSGPGTSPKPAEDPEKARKVQDLIRKLEGSDKRAAYDAALQLALQGDETAVEPLIGVAERETGMLRVAAIHALGSIGDKRALYVLLQALRDRDVDVRRNAASGLGNLEDESAIEPLIEALRDTDDWVRMNALGSLQKITKQTLRGYDVWREWYRGR
jgi:HEAT repeat protein